MKMVGITIRPLGLEDLHDVFVLGQEVFQEKKVSSFCAWNEKVLAEVLAGNLEISLIAVRKKSVAGFLIGALEEDGNGERVAKIIWLGMRRGEDQAVGRDLIKAFAGRCEEVHGGRILVRIAGSDSEFIDMYQECGFTLSGQVLIMELSCPPGTCPHPPPPSPIKG